HGRHRSEMVKDRLPRSQKSNRGHDRFKDLYANNQHPATTHPAMLANRAPRQVAQSVTTSDGATTTTTTGNETTPVTKTPKKHKPNPKKAKWSHVPSASDGDATHFENFENEGGAQLAVARMKTRELQWKSKETTEVGGTVEASTDAGESFRGELGGSTGTGGSDGSGGSVGELRLKALERTQEDDGRQLWRDGPKRDVTQEDADQREVRHEPTVRKALPLLSPQPSPSKLQPSREAIKTVQQPVAVIPAAAPPLQAPPPPAVAPPPAVKVLLPHQVTKREQRPKPLAAAAAPSVKKPIKASARENKKPAPALQPQQPPSNSTTTREEVTKRDKRQPQTGVKKNSKKETGEPTSANYLLAVKLMKILKRNNYLENALRFEDSEKVRKHFETAGFNQPPPPQILTLLNRALDFVLETVLFRAEDLDTCLTNDLRVFIIKKQEARECILEVIFHRPDLMPNKWGGARVEAKRSKTSKSSEGNGNKRGWFSSFFR
ncbi:hypothetical protein PENTCL1PPCAC_1572, partial [Pristionchus entomophagus]